MILQVIPYQSQYLRNSNFKNNMLEAKTSNKSHGKLLSFSAYLPTGHNLSEGRVKQIILQLDASLNRLKVIVGREVVDAFSNVLSSKTKAENIFEGSNLGNLSSAINKRISEIVSENDFQKYPELQAIVAEMKAKALADISAMLNIVSQ